VPPWGVRVDGADSPWACAFLPLVERRSTGARFVGSLLRMRASRFLFVAALAAAFASCKKTTPVDADDGVRCCFLVPYEGLNGQTINQSQCKVDLVCPKPGDENTDDVCKPLACKTGDVNPYGIPGPGGASAVSGNCTVDLGPIEVIKDGCPMQEGGAGTDQPPPPAPGDASGADSSGT
jgi:hypothetical protein